ncbi:MAG: type 4a pilus biogenesis protein PilO [Sulfurisoma sp.]|nr:type 4a pilus biogenesis protein PilO [Sulfurisoma sp.]
MSAPKIALKVPKVDFQALASDFKTLDPKDPGLWPIAPKVVILTGLFVGLLAAEAWFGWRAQYEELEQKQKQEQSLKDDWLGKKKQAVNLDAHRKQLAEIDQKFGALLKQLPNKTEMESLLIDINQAGLGRGLQFEIFRPGGESRRDFYAELPVSLKLTGNYHDLGAFAGDIARLSRIVTLNEISLVPGKDNVMTMDTVAKTFRYLDEQELAAVKKAQQGAKK